MGGRVHGLVLLARQRLAHAVAIRPGRLDQRRLDLALRRLRHPFYQRPVGLCSGSGLEDAPEPGRGIAALGDQQHACRVPVEAMDEPRAIAEAIRHPGQDAVDVALGARAALHGDAERLVQHHHGLVLEQDQALDEIAIALGKPERRHHRRAGLGRLAGHGRHPHLLPGLEPGIGLHALAVHAHLARPQQFLQVAISYRWKMHAEPAVQSQARLVALDHYGFNRCIHGDVLLAWCLKPGL
jgi:hypothetical protein